MPLSDSARHWKSISFLHHLIHTLQPFTCQSNITLCTVTMDMDLWKLFYFNKRKKNYERERREEEIKERERKYNEKKERENKEKEENEKEEKGRDNKKEGHKKEGGAATVQTSEKAKRVASKNTKKTTTDSNTGGAHASHEINRVAGGVKSKRLREGRQNRGPLSDTQGPGVTTLSQPPRVRTHAAATRSSSAPQHRPPPPPPDTRRQTCKCEDTKWCIESQSGLTPPTTLTTSHQWDPWCEDITSLLILWNILMSYIQIIMEFLQFATWCECCIKHNYNNSIIYSYNIIIVTILLYHYNYLLYII